MSRIGNKPVPIEGGAKVSVSGRTIEIEGPKGKLSYEYRPEVSVRVDEDAKSVVIDRQNDERTARELHGLTRALIANMVVGVTKGYEKRLEVVGVGYLAAVQGDVLQLRVGYANELHQKIPKELDVTCPDQTHIVVQGCDKQKVGQFAAEVRACENRSPTKARVFAIRANRSKSNPVNQPPSKAGFQRRSPRFTANKIAGHANSHLSRYSTWTKTNRFKRSDCVGVSTFATSFAALPSIPVVDSSVAETLQLPGGR